MKQSNVRNDSFFYFEPMCEIFSQQRSNVNSKSHSFIKLELQQISFLFYENRCKK